MVVKVWNINGLVNHNVIDLASQRIITGKRITNGGIGFGAKGGLIPFDSNKSVVVKQN